MTTTRPPPPRPSPKQSWLRRAFGKQPIGWLFVAPYVLFLVSIYLGPLVLQFWISFRDFFFSAPGVDVETPFIGLGNYVDALTDPTFLSSLWHSVIFLVINVPITVVGSLVLAYALNAKIRGLTFFRTSYYVPYVTASVSVIAVWLFLFSSDGLVNQLLGQFAPDPSWLINKNLVMPMIAIFVAWKQMGYFILLYLAALQNVSKETYEAADLDGCTGFQKFRYVTVPAVRPATVLVVILATTTGMNLFTEPYLLTNGGGPNGASITPVFYIYQKGVEQGEAGFAAAMGMILILITFLIAMVQRRVLERD